MERTSHFIDVHDSGSKFWNSTDSEDENSIVSAVAFQGKLTLGNKKETLSLMKKTEYFTTEIVGNSSNDLFSDEFY